MLCPLSLSPLSSLLSPLSLLPRLPVLHRRGQPGVDEALGGHGALHVVVRHELLDVGDLCEKGE